MSARREGNRLRLHQSALMRLALVLVATLSSLFAGELTLRILENRPLTELELRKQSRPMLSPPSALTAWAAIRPLAPGVDPAWIDEQPPQPSTSTELDAELLGRRQLAGDWQGRALHLDRQWNANLTSSWGCGPDGLFRNFPVPAYLFDPPDKSSLPVYRFLLQRVLPTGLVTNKFGWRGPEISLDKPPRTVRLAFVGASTTVGSHRLPFSYPEHVVHWLNLWADKHGLDVQFDGINAGREGIGSANIAAIVSSEVLPAEPDLVVYYEGANQLNLDDLRSTTLADSGYVDVEEIGVFRRALIFCGSYSVLARRVADLLLEVAEPNRPSYTLQWPSDVDEQTPDLASPDLPSSLPQILHDLKSIQHNVENDGAELALGSFVWLVHDGMRVTPFRHRWITAFYRSRYGPYRYADIRRLADFQNLVFRRFAETNGLLFIDLAGKFPHDPDFFIDGIHFNGLGIRIQAWIVLQALIPRITEKLVTGEWPRPDRVTLEEHPYIRPSRVVANVCEELEQESK